MATIEKIQRLSGPVYKAKVRRQGHSTTCKTFKTRSDALRWVRKFEAALDRDSAGLVAVGEQHTLAEAIKRYRAERLPALSAGAQRAYAPQLAYWDQTLGHLRLSELSAAKITKCRDQLRDSGRSSATCNRYLASLQAVLTRAIKRWHWLETNPVSRVAKDSENNARKRFLSEAELQRLLIACRASDSPDLLLAVLLSITTGARRGEILGLRWGEVDLTHHTLRLLDTKNRDSRSVPIVAQALPLLEQRRSALKQSRVAPMNVDAALVFPSRVSRKTPVDLRTPWATALRRAGIEDFHWHDLRHSAASFLAMSGASLREIGEVLGHRSTQTTKRYAHLTEEHTHALVRNVADKLLGGDK